MSSNAPIVRQVAWISLVPQLIFMGLLILLWYQLQADKAILYGAMTYIVISFGLRTLLLRDHRSGMALFKQEKYLEAIAHFEKSYSFFNRYNWIDKYRYLTHLNSSAISYKEMALNNIANCYGQAGDGIKAKEYYERTLKEFPESGMAKAALRLLNSAGKHAP